jgi:hypothetical protein
MPPPPQTEFHVRPTAASPTDLLAGLDSAWAAAEVVTYGPAVYATAFRALWSDRALYTRWDATDPDPWWTMTRRDDPIWEEEVVEIFLDLDRSGTHYAELEISPANIVCDVRMIAPMPDRQMDLAWNLDGLETAVRAIRDERGAATGWTATATMPWTGFASLPSARQVTLPPRPGDRWRSNVFRIKRPGGPTAPDRGVVYAAWSPPSGPSFHDAGAFRDLVFVGE